MRVKISKNSVRLNDGDKRIMKIKRVPGEYNKGSKYEMVLTEDKLTIRVDGITYDFDNVATNKWMEFSSFTMQTFVAIVGALIIIIHMIVAFAILIPAFSVAKTSPNARYKLTINPLVTIIYDKQRMGMRIYFTQWIRGRYDDSFMFGLTNRGVAYRQYSNKVEVWYSYEEYNIDEFLAEVKGLKVTSPDGKLTATFEPDCSIRINGRTKRLAHGTCRFAMQADNNLVAYSTADGKPLWATNTNGFDGSFALTLSNSGELCLSEGGKCVYSIWSVYYK